MIEIIDNLFIGSDHDCVSSDNAYSVIHACKTCHQRVIGYRGSLPQAHPNYLILEQGNNLYLNMVDMDRELLPRFTHPIMKSAMSFIEKNITKKKILVHCNQGMSRSPSIGLVYLARVNKIASGSYEEAIRDFRPLYPGFNPGRGIALYMKNNWQNLVEL